MIPISAEALHPGSATRQKAKKRRRVATAGEPSEDAMTELYTWFCVNGRTLEGCPLRMQEKAQAHLAQRIKLLTTLRDVASAEGKRTDRLRTQLRWLRRWAQVLQAGVAT